MSSQRKKHLPLKIRGADWQWIYRDSRRLAGIVQRVKDEWRGIRIGPDGRDREIQSFATREQAVAFITTGVIIAGDAQPRKDCA